VLHEKAYFFNADESGKFKEESIPPDMEDEVSDYREELIEAIAESSDELLEKYLEGEGLNGDELEEGLRSGTINRHIIPISCGSASKNMGIQTLLNLMVSLLPSPVDRGPKVGEDPKTGDKIERNPDPEEPFSALVIKTISDPYAGRLSIFRVFSGIVREDSTFYNATHRTKERFGQLFRIKGKEQKAISEAGPGEVLAVAKLKETTTGDTLCDEKAQIVYGSTELMPTIIDFAVEPKSKGDEEKIFSSLARLQEEDLTLRIHRDDQTKQMIISGMGEIHIEATIDKLKRKFGVEVNLKTPKVPYKETIKGKTRIQGKYKKQSGGRGQYGDCWIQMEPLPSGGTSRRQSACR
jgi:elongation factor G